MKKIVVLGGGISGYGSAILAKKKGFDVFLSDKGRIADRYKAKLEQWQVPYEEGHHSEERILAADEVVKSPGIPDKAPLIVKLREAGIPVISEMEFAGRYLGKARTICVTGSNGKTTTTSLIYKILRDAGYNVALGGNIGESFAYSVATGDYDWYVLELSSFQLDGMFRFRAHIGVLTNITPDHLDRYDYCFQNYVDAKMRITQNQNSRDFFIYSGDDEVIWQQLPKYDLRMKQLPFAAKNAVASGAGDAFLLDGKFTATVGRESVEIDTAKMRIPGLHNAYNAMAAALAALKLDALFFGLFQFSGSGNACFNLHSKVDFFRCSKQGNLTDFFQIHTHRVARKQGNGRISGRLTRAALARAFALMGNLGNRDFSSRLQLFFRHAFKQAFVGKIRSLYIMMVVVQISGLNVGLQNVFGVVFLEIMGLCRFGFDRLLLGSCGAFSLCRFLLGSRLLGWRFLGRTLRRLFLGFRLL